MAWCNFLSPSVLKLKWGFWQFEVPSPSANGWILAVHLGTREKEYSEGTTACLILLNRTFQLVAKEAPEHGTNCGTLFTHLAGKKVVNCSWNNPENFTFPWNYRTSRTFKKSLLHYKRRFWLQFLNKSALSKHEMRCWSQCVWARFWFGTKPFQPKLSIFYCTITGRPFRLC